MAMSAKSSPSPPQQAANLSEEKLPEGYCRYLLPQAELRGQRCGCVHFTLNKNIPSAGCVCGHQSCFHTNEPYSPELEHLRTRVKALQEQISHDEKERQCLVARLSTLEEVVEKSREEASLEIKGSYRNLSRAWHSIGELERQGREYELRFRHHEEQIQSLKVDTRRLEDRQLELSDADLSLEERIESLEELEDTATYSRQPDRNGTPPRASGDSSDLGDLGDPGNVNNPNNQGSNNYSVGSRSRTHRTSSTSTGAGHPRTMTPTLRPLRTTPASDGKYLWTVHISLLPASTLPFPFERGTNAYKRCLSRGLHQMVAINGHDAESFVNAVSKAFSSLLKGRSWMPLQAQLCNAQTLQGLPMLRQLDESLVHGKYDLEFLKKHCAVCDPSDNIDSLYIAMRYETLSWHALRRAPVYMEGLESSWVYDSYLDPGNPFDDDDEAIDDIDRPSAGDILPNTFSNVLKRQASEMSSFGSATATATTTEGEGSRPKIPRVQLNLPNIPEGRRRVETV